MKVAFGLKAHSGWAALVVLGTKGKELEVLDRRRLELIDKGEEWAKQPYHAAEGLKPMEARKVVKRGVESARRIALRQMRALTKRARENGHELAGCGLLVNEPMPDWSVDEILAVHFRMHKAEGVLFREVLARAASECDLRLVEIPEKLLLERAESMLATSLNGALTKIAALGKSVGPPWGKDQKDATLAAMIALQINY
jgi:hypothetical protein